MHRLCFRHDILNHESNLQPRNHTLATTQQPCIFHFFLRKHKIQFDVSSAYACTGTGLTVFRLGWHVFYSMLYYGVFICASHFMFLLVCVSFPLGYPSYPPLCLSLSFPQCARWLWETVWNVSSTLWVCLVQRAAVDSKAFWEPPSLYQHRQVENTAKVTCVSLTLSLSVLFSFCFSHF